MFHSDRNSYDHPLQKKPEQVPIHSLRRKFEFLPADSPAVLELAKCLDFGEVKMFVYLIIANRSQSKILFEWNELWVAHAGGAHELTLLLSPLPLCARARAPDHLRQTVGPRHTVDMKCEWTSWPGHPVACSVKDMYTNPKHG